MPTTLIMICFQQGELGGGEKLSTKLTKSATCAEKVVSTNKMVVMNKYAPTGTGEDETRSTEYRIESIYNEQVDKQH